VMLPAPARVAYAIGSTAESVVFSISDDQLHLILPLITFDLPRTQPRDSRSFESPHWLSRHTIAAKRTLPAGLQLGLL
jgi:hypothetical protein